jgi:hypothetical protein
LFSNKVWFSGTDWAIHSVFITSSTGKQMFTTIGDADKFLNYTISTNDLGIAPGLYLVQVKTADDRVEMKRVGKEWVRINF